MLLMRQRVLSDMKPKILIVVNKDEPELQASETFLHAHICGLPTTVDALIGNPGMRKNYHTGKFLVRQGFFFRGLRKIERLIKRIDVKRQDSLELADYIRRNDIDIVLAEYGSTAVSVISACKMSNAPLVVHFHGWDAYSNYMINAYGHDYKMVFEYATVIVAVSKHMRRQLITLGAPVNKTFYNPCGADIKHNKTAVPMKAGKRFIMVGRLTPKKAPLISIQAFFKVYKNHPDSSLDIVGDGPLMGEVQAKIAELGISCAVNIHGSQSHEYVVEQLAQSACFIQHSVVAEDNDHEGTPVGILEAMVMALPIVSTRHAGILDVIEDEETGYLVDEYDIDAMANRMNEVIHNIDAASEMGLRARKKALAENTVEVSLNKLWAIIGQVK